jgi:hypothetical protein
LSLHCILEHVLFCFLCSILQSLVVLSIYYYCTTFGLCSACTIIFLLSSLFLLTMLPILFPSTGVLSSQNKRREPRSCLVQRNFIPTCASHPPQDPFVQASHQPHPMTPSRRCPSVNHQLPPPSPLLQYPAVRLASTTSSTARSGQLLSPRPVLAWSPSFPVSYVPRPLSSLYDVSSPFSYASWCL